MKCVSLFHKSPGWYISRIRDFILACMYFIKLRPIIRYHYPGIYHNLSGYHCISYTQAYHLSRVVSYIITVLDIIDFNTFRAIKHHIQQCRLFMVIVGLMGSISKCDLYLTLFTCILHKYLILWPQMSTNIILHAWQASHRCYIQQK